MRKGRNFGQGRYTVRVGMAAASMVSRTILLIWNGRLSLSPVVGDAFEFLVSMHKLAASHQKDGYRPKNADRPKTKTHRERLVSHIVKLVNT